MLHTIVLTMLIMVHSMLLQFTGENYADDSFIGSIPMALIKFLISMFFFVNGVRYVVAWLAVSPRSLLLKIVEFIVVPYVTLFWTVKYNLLSITSNQIVAVSALFVLVFYWLGRKNIIFFIGEKMPINDSDIRVLFNTYPPKTRSDITRVDIVILCMWLLPLLFTID